MEKKLNHKQKEFCRYYVQCENVSSAALRAGYSESTAKNLAYQWLKRANFLEFIEQIRKDCSYSFEDYMGELNRAMRLAEEEKNPALLLKIIEAKGRAFGLNHGIPEEEGQNQATQKPDFDLFKELEEKGEVFKKLEQRDT